MFWVSQVFMETLEIDLPWRNDMPSGFGMNLSDEAYLLIEGQLEIVVHHNQIVRGVWEIEADLPEKDIFSTALLLLVHSNETVDAVELKKPSFTGPLPTVSSDYVHEKLLALDESQLASEDETVTRVLKFRASAHYEGESCLTDNDVKWGMGVLGARLLNDEAPIRSQVVKLRMLKGWAAERNLDDVTELFNHVMKAWRQGGQSQKDDVLRLIVSDLEQLSTPQEPQFGGVRISKNSHTQLEIVGT